MSPRNSASKSGLPLALLVLRVGANHAHHAAPVNHFALVANLFNRCPYFHFLSLLLSRWRDELASTNSAADSLKGCPTAPCSGRRCGRALNRMAKAPRLLCLPREYE